MSVSNIEFESSLALSFVYSLGPQIVNSLFKTMGSAQEILKFCEGGGVKVDLGELDNAKKSAREELAKIEKNKIQIFLIQDDTYPYLLKQISCPPPILYVKGQKPDWSKLSLAVVGSRKCTHYGAKVAQLISSELAKLGIVNVSGLARGIDSIVHQSTLDAGGITWAILGHGLGWIYPPENKALAEKIQESGALISEFPMDTKPLPGNFPRRNRIISGLTSGTIVVEGGEKSGSLITARMAAQEGREVMAVPGPITSELSVASHQLIQSGAILVNSVLDILRAFPSLGSEGEKVSAQIKQSVKADLLANHQSLLEIIGEVPISKEELSQRAKANSKEISSAIVELELMGCVKSLPGGFIVKT